MLNLFAGPAETFQKGYELVHLMSQWGAKSALLENQT